MEAQSDLTETILGKAEIISSEAVNVEISATAAASADSQDKDQHPLRIIAFVNTKSGGKKGKVSKVWQQFFYRS